MARLMLLTMLGSYPPYRWLMLLVAIGLVALIAAVTRSLLRGMVWGGFTTALLYLFSAGIIVEPARPESGVLGDTRSVMSAELAYSQSNEGAFGQLTCLATPTSCGWPAGTTPFVDAEIAALKPRQGYSRSFVAGPSKSGSPDVRGIASFAYLSAPIKPGESGFRGFCGDDTGRICFTTDGTLPPVSNGRCSESCTLLK